MTMIFLDHASTTRMHPDVIADMISCMQEHVGNASSVHAFGRAAKQRLNQARDRIAAQLNCQSQEIVFTSGGTESDNMAIIGAALYEREHTGKKHLITTTTEHHAVLHTCEHLERMGVDVTYVPVDSTGQVSVQAIEEAIRPDTFLISVMYGNNEVGTLQPIEEIGKVARAHGVRFHVDAVQALGSIPLDLSALPVDLMSFSSHKINGPQGVGALYIDRNTAIDPILYGGLQERKRRSGTENIAGVVGFAKALEIAASHIDEKVNQTREFRQLMIKRLEAELGSDQIVVNGHPVQHLPHILNISFPGIATETMLMNLDMAGIAASSGSACTSGSLELSHVLEAMHLPDPILRSAIRFSFGLGNTMEDVEIAVQKIATIVNRLRKRK